jgi:CRISPR-associated Cas5-like protein
MKALLVRIAFSEAHFRAHYTEVSPLTYLVPLPSTVLGIYGATLGWKREEIGEKAYGLYFGAMLLSFKGLTREFARIVQFKEGRPKFPPPVENFELLVEPSYLLAMAGDDYVVESHFRKLQNGYEYLPYGGRNDYFLKDFEVLGLDEVMPTKQIESYAPSNWVERIESRTGGWVRGLQVKHKIKDASEWFYFAYRNVLQLNREIRATKGIGLYPIDWFYWGKPIREQYAKSV